LQQPIKVIYPPPKTQNKSRNCKNAHEYGSLDPTAQQRRVERDLPKLNFAQDATGIKQHIKKYNIGPRGKQYIFQNLNSPSSLQRISIMTGMKIQPKALQNQIITKKFMVDNT